jgi:hypothetical protein
MDLIIYAIMQFKLFLKERKESKRKYGKHYGEEDYLFLPTKEIVFDMPPNITIPQINSL